MIGVPLAYNLLLRLIALLATLPGGKPPVTLPEDLEKSLLKHKANTSDAHSSL